MAINEIHHFTNHRTLTLVVVVNWLSLPAPTAAQDSPTINSVGGLGLRIGQCSLAEPDSHVWLRETKANVN